MSISINIKSSPEENVSMDVTIFAGVQKMFIGAIPRNHMYTCKFTIHVIRDGSVVSLM